MQLIRIKESLAKLKFLSRIGTIYENQLIVGYKFIPIIDPIKNCPVYEFFYEAVVNSASDTKLIKIKEEPTNKSNEKTIEQLLEENTNILRESEIKFNLLTNNINDVLWVVDLNMNHIYISPSIEEFQQYTPDEFLKVPNNKSHHPDSYQTTIDLMDVEIQKLNEGDYSILTKIYVLEIKYIRKDGTTVLGECKCSFLLDDDNNIIGIHGVTRDITERRALEMQLRHAQKMEAVGLIAGGIAHDFNNIVNAIVGYTELCLDELGAESPITQYLEHILKASYRAKNLVNQIKTFSKNNPINDIKPVYLSNVAKETCSLIKTSLPINVNIQFIKNSDVWLTADPTNIYQVVLNLVTNAYQSMEKNGGIITVIIDREVFDEVEYGKLIVIDKGEGIARSNLQKIFDPFFTTKEPDKGTGMGLAVVHGIVDNLKGHIRVSSDLGKGSIFEILFPLMEIKPDIKKKLDKPVKRGSGHILFVDDEQDIVNVAKKSLIRLGYTCECYTNPFEAFDAFKKSPYKYDLVITDYNMPRMKGTQLALQCIYIRSDIKTLLISGYMEDEAVEHVKALGIKQFISKPFEIDNFSHVIFQLLN